MQSYKNNLKWQAFQIISLILPRRLLYTQYDNALGWQLGAEAPLLVEPAALKVDGGDAVGRVEIIIFFHPFAGQ